MQGWWIVGLLGISGWIVAVAVFLTMVQLSAGRMALHVLAWAAAEEGLRYVAEWEVRAMAAFVFEREPMLQRLSVFVSEAEFEERCVKAWRDTKAEYRRVLPRENTELFGDVGPF